MKILTIFIDALRPGLLNLCDNTRPVSALDTCLKNVGGGGTFFTNCYTSAPDTPRSLACFWSSNYPRFNGCDSRAKYYAYYQNYDRPSFLSLMKNEGYTFNFYISEVRRLIGELPFLSSDSEHDNYSGDKTLEEYLRTLDVKDNSLTCFMFKDFHMILDDYFGQTKHLETKGLKIAADILEMINAKLGFDNFDMVILFSDHGFKLYEETFDTNLKYLGKPRTQIMMFVHKKGDTQFSCCNKLASIFDVYPTVLDFCGINYDKSKIEGINLFSPEAHDMLMIEDYSKFYLDRNTRIEKWAVRTEKGLAACDYHQKWEAEYDITDEEIAAFTSLLSKKSVSFDEIAKIERINNIYRTITPGAGGNALGNMFFDGKKRFRTKHYVMRRVLKKLQKIKSLLPDIIRGY